MSHDRLYSALSASSSRVLVTGGAGFIGSHLVEALLTAGHEVRVLDNFSTGDRRNLIAVRSDVEIVEGDIRSYERVHAAVSGCDVVFHQAALPSVPRSIQDPLTSNETNVTGTLNLLLAARDANVRRVVYASSSSVYGAAAGEVKREDMPVAPLSPYGVAKFAGEAYCRSFHEAYGLETVALRYFNVFGPRQNPISEYAAVIPSFISAALTGQPATLYGDGLQSRDFTYVTNVVEANLRAATTHGVGGDVFNVACGESHTLLAVLEVIASIVRRAPQVLEVAPRVGEVRQSRADITKARTSLGFRPTVGLEQGLGRTIDCMAADESLVPQIEERRRWLAVAAR